MYDWVQIYTAAGFGWVFMSTLSKVKNLTYFIAWIIIMLLYLPPILRILKII